MIKTLRNLLKQDKERFVVPRGVQDVIPIKAIYDDGIFQVGRDILPQGKPLRNGDHRNGRWKRQHRSDGNDGYKDNALYHRFSFDGG